MLNTATGRPAASQLLTIAIMMLGLSSEKMKKIMIVFNVLAQSASVCFSTRLSVTLADCVKTAKHYHNLFSLRIGLPP